MVGTGKSGARDRGRRAGWRRTGSSIRVREGLRSGTSQCQTIDGLMIDTGSTGLRILGSALTLALPAQTIHRATRSPSATCSATRSPGGRSRRPTCNSAARPRPVPRCRWSACRVLPRRRASCAASGLPSADALSTLGANGILGVASARSTAGRRARAQGSGNPGLYYACTSTGGMHGDDGSGIGAGDESGGSSARRQQRHHPRSACRRSGRRAERPVRLIDPGHRHAIEQRARQRHGLYHRRPPRKLHDDVRRNIPIPQAS